MVLNGEEQFNGPDGSAPNSLYFDYDLGATGWGNDEKQTYTSNSENVRLNGAGQLVIEARIKMPAGQGVHPAFWMVGTKLGEVG